MKLFTTILLTLCVGCTSFRVHQVDDSAGERVVTTDFKATAWFSSAQTLSKLKALNTDKTQSFGVDSSQQQGATNMVAALEAIAKIVSALHPAP